MVHTPRSRSCSVLSITASPFAHCSLYVNSIGWCFLVICIDLHLEMLSWSSALEEDFGSLSGHYLTEWRLLQSLFLSKVLCHQQTHLYVVCMYVCKTLFKHASLDNYLQLFSTRGVTQIKYIEYL